MNENITEIVAYADGACKNNNSHTKKRLGGCGFVIMAKNSTILDQFFANKISLNALRTAMLKSSDFTCMAVPMCEKIELPNKFSNNRAELEAFNGVLAHVLQSGHIEQKKIALTIKLDSEYVIKVFNGAWSWRKNGWKISSGTVAANIDYIIEMIAFVEALKRRGHMITVCHVMAHQTEPSKDVQQKWLDWFFNDFADRLSNIAAQVETDINYNAKKRKRK